MDRLEHECGVVLLCVKDTPAYRYSRMAMDMLIMQEHRGRQGAGMGMAYVDPSTGTGFSVRKVAGYDAVWQLQADITTNPPVPANIYLGHVRYATSGDSSMLEHTHPLLCAPANRQELMLCGNFHLNGLEQGCFDGISITQRLGSYIDKDENLLKALSGALAEIDGGFVMCGVTGQGEAFAVRDSHGIRPAYYYEDDTCIAVASERMPLARAFKVKVADIMELPAGHALTVAAGTVEITRIFPPATIQSCPFERIYFSSGTDPDIAGIRRNLGKNLAIALQQAASLDPENTIVTYVPRTAMHAWEGLLSAMPEMPGIPLLEKTTTRRTFIGKPDVRAKEAGTAYRLTDIDVIPAGCTIVVVDDSVVRGTTFAQSVSGLLSRLRPRHIIIASAAPQLRYPDCYGIDLSTLDELVAFRAAVEILEEDGRTDVLADVYEACMACHTDNHVCRIYDGVDYARLCRRIARMLVLLPSIEADAVFQSIEGMHQAMAPGMGDWCFTGNYPTPGGYAFANRAYISFYRQRYMTHS